MLSSSGIMSCLISPPSYFTLYVVSFWNSLQCNIKPAEHLYFFPFLSIFLLLFLLYPPVIPVNLILLSYLLITSYRLYSFLWMQYLLISLPSKQKWPNFDYFHFVLLLACLSSLLIFKFVLLSVTASSDVSYPLMICI